MAYDTKKLQSPKVEADVTPQLMQPLHDGEAEEVEKQVRLYTEKAAGRIPLPTHNPSEIPSKVNLGFEITFAES